MTAPTAPGEPFAMITERELERRTGYPPDFLGTDVPLPVLTGDIRTLVLHYLHYSVLFRPDRRFAAVTGLALDGARLQDIPRTDRWKLDPRLAAELQAG